ncbi:hypothetical protein H2203_005842 [Taxawa tesnikishii (nom. ined.)]|nr:hypothetical protein H2203_005842 [Dothideales sp. JES 119]
MLHLRLNLRGSSIRRFLSGEPVTHHSDGVFLQCLSAATIMYTCMTAELRNMTMTKQINQVIPSKVILIMSKNSCGELVVGWTTTLTRDFQLVTWGADQELVLHRMQDKQYRTVGWHKGMHLDENWELTRRGAPYKTYRDEMVIHDVDGFDALSAGFNGIHRSSTSPGMSKVPIPVARGWTDGGSMMTYSGLQTRNVYSNDRETNLIAWMKGIKIGKRGSAMPEKERPRSSTFGDSSISGTLNEPEKLSDEIIHVADTYKKVKLEEADISARRIKVSLNGPWGYDSKPAYIQLRADFPSDYPEKSVPNLDIERTSSIPEATLDKLNHEMAVIAGHFVSRGHGCLEAVLSYLLGERSLEESTGLLIQADDEEGVGGVTEEDESSSDEEDVLMGDSAVTQSETLDMGGITGTGVVLDNTKVPLPKRCGALWAPNGRLVCFFPPKEPQPSVLREIILAESGKSGRTHIFEGFGRLNVKSPELKAEAASLNGAEDDESDEYESTSSSSSDSDGFRVLENRFNPPTAWRGASLRFQKLRSQSVEGSQRTSTSLNRRGAAASKDKTIVSLYDLDYLISAHRSLAEGYAVFGWGPDVCSHNAAVASEHGFEDLADMWQFAKLILCNDVPLEIITLGLDSRKEDVNVLAKRALVSIKRKDSGLDLSFDEPEAVSKPQLTARVKWGNHPLASAWLIRSLFQHCEQRGDVQMLAMLSCVFAEPPAKTDKSLPRDLSPAHKVCIAYLINWEQVNLRERIQDSHERTDNAVLDREYTPMGFPRGSTSTAQSYSNSPDAQRVSVPNSVNSLGILARPFQLAASPPQRPKLSGEDASTPSASGVTWGPSTVFGSNATLRKTYQAHSPYDVDSDTEEDEPAVPSPGVKITLKNQHLFDDEAYPTVPLLDPKDSAKFVCYRDSYAHLLDAWGLTIQKNEILKLNGFTSLVADVSIDASAQTTFPLTKGDPANVEASNTQGLEIVRFCGRCGKSGTVNTRAGGRCANCGGRSPTLSCSICYESIFGLYKACLNCGHIAHLSCLQLLLESSFDDDQLKCEAGCGCECDHQAAVTIDEILGVEEEKQPSAAMPNQEPSWEYLHHRLNSGIHRRGSVGEGRRPSGFADRIRQDPRRTSNAAIMRTRTKSYEH